MRKKVLSPDLFIPLIAALVAASGPWPTEYRHTRAKGPCGGKRAIAE